MLVIETINEILDQINRAKSMAKSVGFVPTMGALHLGHLELVHAARQKSDFVVVSIFVNPTQFNNPEDLLKYPKTLEADLALLQGWADLVFVPSIAEMYPETIKKTWDFGALTSTLEGFYRPGHFDGVCTIVQKLFEIVTPELAFFGKKDYQQLAVIKALVESEKLELQIIGCETVREDGGLAMSSRNMRLSPTQRDQAKLIFKTLQGIAHQRDKRSVAELVLWGKQQFDENGGLRIEYLEIVDALTFEPISSKKTNRLAVVLLAAFAGEIRLIDNLEIQWQ